MVATSVWADFSFIVPLLPKCSAKALSLTSIPDYLIEYVGKMPFLEHRRLPYPGGILPMFSCLKDFDVEVPNRPDNVLAEDGYDYLSLLNPVFDIGEASKAYGWVQLYVAKSICDLGEARDLVVEASDVICVPLTSALLNPKWHHRC